MKIREEKGFTLLEVIISISILTIGILAVASMQATALRGDSFAQSRTEASTWAQDKMEEFMAIPFDSTKLNIGYSETDTPGNYTVTVNVANGPVNNTRSITVTVNQGAKQIIQLTGVRCQLLE